MGGVLAQGSGGRPAAEANTRSLCDVSKRPVVIVVIEAILAEVRYVNVWPAIVIEIPDRHAKAPSFICHASFFCDVGECPVMVVVQQHRAWRSFFAFQRGKC